MPHHRTIASSGKKKGGDYDENVLNAGQKVYQNRKKRDDGEREEYWKNIRDFYEGKEMLTVEEMLEYLQSIQQKDHLDKSVECCIRKLYIKCGKSALSPDEVGSVIKSCSDHYIDSEDEDPEAYECDLDNDTFGPLVNGEKRCPITDHQSGGKSKKSKKSRLQSLQEQHEKARKKVQQLSQKLRAEKQKESKKSKAKRK